MLPTLIQEFLNTWSPPKNQRRSYMKAQSVSLQILPAKTVALRSELYRMNSAAISSNAFANQLFLPPPTFLENPHQKVSMTSLTRSEMRWTTSFNIDKTIIKKPNLPVSFNGRMDGLMLSETNFIR